MKHLVLFITIIPFYLISQSNKNYPVCHRTMGKGFILIMIDSSSTNMNGHENHGGDIFGPTDQNGDGEITGYDCELLSQVPVNLIEFTAEYKGDYIEVSWITASENNCSHYILHKSTNMSNWEEIKLVEGSGNSSVNIHYLVLDDQITEKVHYYNLLQVDFDGNSRLYGPIYVNLDSELYEEGELINIDPLGRLNNKQDVR